MSTRWVLRNLSSKARFLSTSTTSSYITTTTPIDFYPTPSLFATTKVLGCQGTYLCRFRAFHGATYQIHQEKNSVVEVSPIFAEIVPEKSRTRLRFGLNF
ncbi:uncharacterized protein LOC113300616 isoform X2 [Papaver somniferum]|uniref:uncharacterized protein LOC113300616 isoform X2 n=1 Tax=Papaver somniferum TaxID=3469 RepID=UPI000E6F6249|nr:uncharacterized protein LOC113300616 isoform X2 [Papaver somniferum]